LEAEIQEPISQMKDKATVCFRRLGTGEVIGEIVSEGGEVLLSKTFGELTDEEILKVLEVFQAENSGIVIHPIKLTGN
jgi:hypothetical protein